jgi:hypothetical protein
MSHLPILAAQCFGLDAFSPWEKRARFSVGLGCPSSGGQRTGGDKSSRLLARLVTSWRSSRHAQGWQEGRLRIPAFAAGVATLCRAKAFARSAHGTECSSTLGLTAKAEMPRVSTRHPSAGWLSGLGVVRFLASRSCLLLAQPRSPNHSVKGTSCGKPQSAPYVER